MSNALAETSEASDLVKMLINFESARCGKARALKNLARAVGALPGTIENLQRGRSKNVAGWLRDALRLRLIRELEAELVKQYHEQAILNATGADPRSSAASANRADIASLLSALWRK